MNIDWTRGARAGGIVACAAVLGCAGGADDDGRVGQAAQALGGNVSLTAGAGVGSAQFSTDEFGAADPCCGTGSSVVFNPSSALGPTETVCNMFLEVIDPSASGGGARALLTSCPIGPLPAAVTTDTVIGGTSRHTMFSLPSLPGLDVDLVQTASSAVQLDQTYTFTDTTGSPRSLVMVFFHDIDLPFLNGVSNANGWMNNLGRRGGTPASVTIMDDTRAIRVTLSSAPGSGTAAVVDGYRVAQFLGTNETEDFEAPGTVGLPAAHLNGVFLSPGQPPANTSFAGEGPGDLNCDGLTDQQAPTTGASQWHVNVPAGGTATLLTSTVYASGPDPVTYGTSSCATKCISIQRGHAGVVADTQLGSNTGSQTFGSALVMNSAQVGTLLRQALLEFDVSSIPAFATIVSASMSLYVRPGYASNATVNAHQVLVPWSEATETWSIFHARPAPQYGPVVSSASTTTTTSGPITWNVKPLVAAWVSGAQPNDGVLLEQGSGSTSYWTSEDAALAHQPRLDVCYQ